MTNLALSQFDSLPSDLKSYIDKKIPANLFLRSYPTSYGTIQAIPNNVTRNKTLELSAAMAIALANEDFELIELVYYPTKARFLNVGKLELIELEKQGLLHYTSENLQQVNLSQGVIVWLYKTKATEAEGETLNELTTPAATPDTTSTEVLTLEEAINKYNSFAKQANEKAGNNVSLLQLPLDSLTFDLSKFMQDINTIKSNLNEFMVGNITINTLVYIRNELITLSKVEKKIYEECYL